MGNHPPFVEIFEPHGTLIPHLFELDAWEGLQRAARLAGHTRWDTIRTPHMFMGLLAAESPTIIAWADQFGFDLPGLLQQFCEMFYRTGGPDQPLLRLHREFLSENALDILRAAARRAISRPRITTADLLVTIFDRAEGIVPECFQQAGVQSGILLNVALNIEEQAAHFSQTASSLEPVNSTCPTL